MAQQQGGMSQLQQRLTTGNRPQGVPPGGGGGAPPPGTTVPMGGMMPQNPRMAGMVPQPGQVSVLAQIELGPRWVKASAVLVGPLIALLWT